MVASRNDFAQAKAALLPEEEAPPLPASGAAVEGFFEPSAKFAGARPGWSFKRGPLGVGYYREMNDNEHDGCCAGDRDARG